jgi:hypothetical protein
VSPVKYDLDFYIPEDDILHSYRREILKSFIGIAVWKIKRLYLFITKRLWFNNIKAHDCRVV